MLDASTMLPLLYQAVKAQRDHDIARGTWLRRLRAIESRERTTERARTVIVSSPAHLAGVHKL